MLASSQALRRLSSSLERGELDPGTNEVTEIECWQNRDQGWRCMFICLSLLNYLHHDIWHITYLITSSCDPDLDGFGGPLGELLLEQAVCGLNMGFFSNSIKISDPNIQYPARSHLFRSFPRCFWGSIIFNRSQSQRAQIPRTLSPSLGYFKSLNIRALV